MKPILFIDFDGTLCHDRFWRSLDTESYSRIQKYLFQERVDVVAEWMRGKLDSEVINKTLSESLDLEYESLWSAFTNDCRTMQVSLDVLQLINSFRDCYHTILLTDNMDCFERFTVPTLSFTTKRKTGYNSDIMRKKIVHIS